MGTTDASLSADASPFAAVRAHSTPPTHRVHQPSGSSPGEFVSSAPKEMEFPQVPSGYVKLALENGPFVVDFPMNIVILHRY